MMRTTLAIAVGLLLVATGPAPATPKPCRDRSGKLVECPKPPRKPTSRCKDEKGRFVACPEPARQQPPESNRSS